MTEPSTAAQPRAVTLPAVAVTGSSAHIIHIHAAPDAGPASPTLTGLPGGTAETRDRLHAAIVNAGFTWPQQRVAITISPAMTVADSGIDAALAVALLAAAGHIPAAPQVVCIAELGLDGTLRPVRRVTQRLAAVAAAGFDRVIVANADLPDAAATRGLTVAAADTLTSLVAHLRRDAPRPTALEEVRAARAALSWLVEPDNAALHQLIATDGPIATLHRLLDGDLPPALRHHVIARPGTVDPRQVRSVVRAAADQCAARIVIPEDDEWPTRLNDLSRLAADHESSRDACGGPPPCLWVRGPALLAATLEHSVTIVGARAATAYGAHVAGELGYGLAEQGWTVLSAAGYGIESAAHRGALLAASPTVAVVCAGVDQPYPAGNRAMFDHIVAQGLLVSAWPPGTQPHRHRITANRRLLAALTCATVVVEAAARSGALVVVEHALSLGRPTMVVPGPVTSAFSAGCHQALQQYPQARLVCTAADVLDEIAGPTRAPSPVAQPAATDPGGQTVHRDGR